MKETTFSITVTSHDVPVVPPHVHYAPSTVPVAYTVTLERRPKRRKR